MSNNKYLCFLRVSTNTCLVRLGPWVLQLRSVASGARGGDPGRQVHGEFLKVGKLWVCTKVLVLAGCARGCMGLAELG